MSNLVVDETELINFFEVLPTEQDHEEKEFFDSIIFDINKGNVNLSVYFQSCVATWCYF